MSEKDPQFHKEIEGFFISFAPEEIAAVRDMLTEGGYAPDGDGLKLLVLDLLHYDFSRKESDAERIVRKTKRFVADNPETIRQGINAMRALAGMIGRSRR